MESSNVIDRKNEFIFYNTFVAEYTMNMTFERCQSHCDLEQIEAETADSQLNTQELKDHVTVLIKNVLQNKTHLEHMIGKQMYNRRTSLILFSNKINEAAFLHTPISSRAVKDVFDKTFCSLIRSEMGEPFKVYVRGVTEVNVVLDWSGRSYVQDDSACNIV